ncbi:MAG: CoA pyrophosphatase [Dehalococcoidia bacterium]|nr:CoA pyrophosphatase [Dehalococcoidia bacterium]
MDMKEHIRQALSQRKAEGTSSREAIPAAVLLPLYRKECEWFTLFTRRTYSVEAHKGQISFPGGMHEEEDKTLEYTALRETFEEIGIEPNDIEILGRLNYQLTGGGLFSISPFVGIIPYPYTLKLSNEEVASVLEVPIKYLASEGTMREGLYPLNNGALPVYFWQYGSELIWGATSKILKGFLELVFPHGYPEN